MTVRGSTTTSWATPPSLPCSSSPAVRGWTLATWGTSAGWPGTGGWCGCTRGPPGCRQHPRTARPAGFAAQAADVEELRAHLGLERVDLFAHSAGTLVAQAYATGHAGRVRRLVLVAPVGRAAREADEAEVAAIRATRAGEPWYEEARAAQLALERDGLTPEQQGRFQAKLVPFFWGAWTEELRAAHYAADLVPPRPWIRAAFYGSAAGAAAATAKAAAEPWPATLVVAGGRDGMIGAGPARLVAAARPGARLEVLADCGHRPWGEQPARFTTLLETFLSAA
ncbi:alpha/beta fold hydrolase [Streptacidiphilus sp. PAMC 29251]